MRRLYLKGTLDFSILVPTIVLWIIGNMLVYSATIMHNSGPLHNIYKLQMLWTILGFTIILGIISIPTQIIYKLSPLFYITTLIMLAFVLFDGTSAKGSQRWISIAGVRLQPSEFAKIGLLLMLAKYFTKKSISLIKPKTLVTPAIIIALPFILVLKQPDLGTALVFGAMSVPMFYWAGMPLTEIFYLISPGLSVVLSAIPLIISFSLEKKIGFVGFVPWIIYFLFLLILLKNLRPPKILWILVIIANIGASLMTNVLWEDFLKDYQKMRIISFVNPQADPRGAGYQVIQSMIAIGSGQSFGKGFLKGTQVNLSYLPEQHTDFIFSVLGEQFGFVGAISVLMLFLFIILRAFSMTVRVRNRFSNLLLVGAASMLAFHVVANIAMVVGMMPVTGLPLPLLSYGGSFTLTVSILIGLMLNARSDEHNY